MWLQEIFEAIFEYLRMTCADKFHLFTTTFFNSSILMQETSRVALLFKFLVLPFLTAFVLQAATSDPPPGSETPTQVTMSPAMAGARKSLKNFETDAIFHQLCKNAAKRNLCKVIEK